MRQWLSLVALCAVMTTACGDDDGSPHPTPDGGSGGASSTGGKSNTGGKSTGGSSSGGSSSGGASSGGSSSGGAAPDASDDGGGSGGDDGGLDGGFVSQLPRPIDLPRPPTGRLPADLFPPKL